MNTKTERFLKIYNLNKSDERLEFEKNHTLHLGIISDYGVEFVLKVDHNDIQKITSIYNKIEMRARYNPQRNCDIYNFWIPNNLLEYVKNINDKDVQKYLKSIANKV
jgi:hypothetical protein